MMTSLLSEWRPSTSLHSAPTSRNQHLPAKKKQEHEDPDNAEGAELGDEQPVNHLLTTAEKETIKKLFHNEIVNDTPLHYRQLRPKMMTVVPLRKLIPHKLMVKKVAETVCYFQQQEPRKEPEELPKLKPTPKLLPGSRRRLLIPLLAVLGQSGCRKRPTPLTATLYNPSNR